jgi:diaminopropionate ammonia-lyase
MMLSYARVRFCFNAFREPMQAEAGDLAAVRSFHRSLPGYGATPLRVCPNLAKAAGVQAVYVKDESARFGLNSFKALGASWAMSRLAARASELPRFATATDGNHGRAVAWMARQMGATATVFVPARTVLRRVQNIRQEGAEVRVVNGTYDEAVRQCAAESQKRGWQVVADTGYAGYLEVPQWVMEGYQTLFDEFEEQRAERGLPPPDVVLAQAGVGGLLCAAVNHFRPRGELPLLVSVEPEEADGLLESITSPGGEPATSKGAQNSIMAGLNCGEVSLAAWPAIRRGVDWFIAIEDSYAREAVRLFRDSGIAAGESGAAGLAGLLALCGDSRFAVVKGRLGLSEDSCVMAINTEGPLDAPKTARS